VASGRLAATVVEQQQHSSSRQERSLSKNLTITNITNHHDVLFLDILGLMKRMARKHRQKNQQTETYLGHTFVQNMVGFVQVL
jgi:hypothetical protein